MSDGEITWESLLKSDAPPEAQLKGALFTTYDRADERLLVEHVLPMLLRLKRGPEGEGTERQYFLLELHKRLLDLRDRITIVSSAMHDADAVVRDSDDADGVGDASAQYGWIWNSIRVLTTRAVQHAKLWMFHWGAVDDGPEHLEIVISSANLTHSAFRGQLQAAWRASIALHPQPSNTRLGGWGVLPDFLSELGESAGNTRHVSRFVELLKRAECPPDVSVIASVPGTHSRAALRKTPWGAAGLRGVLPAGRGVSRVSILSPFVGSWSAETLPRWCSNFAGGAERLELVWVDEDHAWARSAHFRAPKNSLVAIVGAGGQLLRLPLGDESSGTEGPFHREQRSTDPRWSHAKLYFFQRGRARRLLVTSANFSASAWGREDSAGQLTIENFELGVSLNQEQWPFGDLEPFDDVDDAFSAAPTPRPPAALLSWVSASWDGHIVRVQCLCSAGHELRANIVGRKATLSVPKWAVEKGRMRSAEALWSVSKGVPATIELTCETETKSVSIFDDRPQAERAEDAPNGGLDNDVLLEMQDALLLEGYGGPVAADVDDHEEGAESDDDVDDESDGDGDGDAVDDEPLGDAARLPNDDSDVLGLADDAGDEVVAGSESYAVPAFVMARRYLGIVDNWAGKMHSAQRRPEATFEVELFRRDGGLLADVLRRQGAREDARKSGGGLGARLAEEEMRLRLTNSLLLGANAQPKQKTKRKTGARL